MGRSIDDILAEAKRPEDEVSLCLRGDLVARFRQLERELETAPTQAVSLGEPAPAAAIAERMQQLRAEMADAEVPFALRALEPRDWERFYGTMPVRKEGEAQDTYSDRWFDWVCELVARTCVDPVMSADQVKALVPNLSSAQWNELSNGAFRLNAGKVSIPFSDAASALTPTSGQTSRRPEQPESPSADSSASNPDVSPPTSTTTPDA